MASYRSVQDALAAIHTETVEAIRSAVRDLLEAKHLYQSSGVDVQAITARNLKLLPLTPPNQSLTAHLADAPRWLWRLKDDGDLIAQLANSVSTPHPQEFLWEAPDVKIYCSICQRVEPFNLDSVHNLLPTSKATKSGTTTGEPDGKGRVQVFALAYLCQSCKSIPEFFLVRRVGAKLVLSGRSPMETVETPKWIPSGVSKYYSGAQVAFQSGQTLAALFMLRTVCEQWVQQFGSEEDKADVAIDKYSQTLPLDFRTRFPSISSIYSELSGAIHRANADDALYTEMQSSLSDHFEARKLFKLSDAPPKPSTAKK